ncbi:FAD dependent oxidoreductase [Lentinus tigrinus ALCF2SS1-7]|uniref:FAD dependent oxidoreductase n=1 Tax=Lentinus tigrinus ALCF2SS1-6 TaxID=1328759 RepID=A0A5C2SDE2_9APHY|nr:FAD dependent oxidoreductase [Lentinus tigrinus ALCF2SS1-6]RPD75965.1 FAD dependent oxidoreductase [Lentinus tigrinus ALCF2SS1-7]
MSSESTVKNIIIIGGGIVGCTTALYLASHPQFARSSATVTLLEASKQGVAQGASGKAGGLVAKWAYPKELVHVSFQEHVRLANEYNGADRWGWRFVNCGSWEGRGEPFAQSGTGVGAGGKRKSLEKTLGLDPDAASKSRKSSGLPDDLNWVKPELTEAYSPMAPSGATAQVHPYLFTTSMLEFAKEKGVKYIPGKVTSIDIDQSGGPHVTGVTYTPTDSDADGPQKLPATHVILAAGAWSPKILSSLPIVGTRAHSITIVPPAGTTIAPYVLFTEIALPSGVAPKGPRHVSPEIYARPTNEVYCCGPGDDSPVPDTVDDVRVDEDACESIREHVMSISAELRAGTVDARQACFLPVVSVGGGPIVGPADAIAKGLYIATGHTCWGICNAPGTAKALAELIMDGKIKCTNIDKLKPSRFL